ncbi:uncharacterized protein LOC119103695 [Pollicipes pollicipes]|uniref:uncharacterized protein LOC119103695 n=1 Tax=Pollicipes pollicipes TaxID=41117 RepID=UPI001884D522|nr:uncharacterized protein LOC119103695 [Pollicipes pollicipes]
MQFLSVFAVLACCGALAASPARPRRDLTLSGGLPLDLLFEACGDTTDTNDIGPCVEELLAGIIDLAKPSFADGLDVGGKTVVLEPLSLKDIPEKADKKFRFSARNLKVHGLSTVQVEDVTLQPDTLALELSFDQLRASTKMTLRYSFITGRPDVELELTRPRIRVEAGWTLGEQDGKLNIQLINPRVTIDLESFSTKISNLGGLGGFLQSLLNNNNEVLLRFFKPELQKQAQKMLEKEFRTIKLVS